MCDIGLGGWGIWRGGVGWGLYRGRGRVMEEVVVMGEVGICQRTPSLSLQPTIHTCSILRGYKHQCIAVYCEGNEYKCMSDCITQFNDLG